MFCTLNVDYGAMNGEISAVEPVSDDFVGGILIDPEQARALYEFTVHNPDRAPLYDYYPGDNLMSARLVDALEKAGVTNIQTFPCTIEDVDTGEERTDYKVVNIVGLVSCADVGASETEELTGDTSYFHKLVIEPERAHGLLCFRLAESLIDVIVHQSVAAALVSQDFEGLVLEPLEESTD